MWHISIQCDKVASGQAVVDVMRQALGVLDDSVIILGDSIEGGGETISLIRNAVHLAGIEFENLSREVAQYDWADFFVVTNRDEADSFDLNRPYPDLVAQAKVTIRVVDGQFVDVYTSDSRVRDRLLIVHSDAEVFEGKPQEMSFPE